LQEKKTEWPSGKKANKRVSQGRTPGKPKKRESRWRDGSAFHRGKRGPTVVRKKGRKMGGKMNCLEWR